MPRGRGGGSGRRGQGGRGGRGGGWRRRTNRLQQDRVSFRQPLSGTPDPTVPAEDTGTADERTQLREEAGTLRQHLSDLETQIHRIETDKTTPTVATINPALCTGCGRCVSVCPQLAIALVENGAEIDADRCNGCGLCIQECPRQAITLKAA